MLKYVQGTIILLAMTFFSITNAMAVEVGKSAPAFSLSDVNGKEHSLENYLKNKYTVIMFIATQCPVSNDYNERMAALHKEYAGKGIAFVGINSNKQESIDEIKEHSADNGFEFDVLKDWENKIADAYDAKVTPEIFVVNGKGTIVYHGRIDDSRKPAEIKTHDARETLDALLAGKAVPRTETKAFGCTIKRVKKDT